MLVRKKSIFVCVSIIISILINYQKPLHSEEPENIDSLISSMWDKIDSQVKGIASSTKSSYEEKLQEKFKVRGIDETELGKKKIEELKKEFSDGLKSYFPKRDLKKYKSRISGIEADKRDAEIEKIIKEEVNNIKSSFDNLLTNKIGEIQSEVDKVVKDVEQELINDTAKELKKIQDDHFNKLNKFYEKEDEEDLEELEKQKKEYIDSVSKSSISQDQKNKLIAECKAKNETNKKFIEDRKKKRTQNKSTEEQFKQYVKTQLDEIIKDNPNENCNSIKITIANTLKKELENQFEDIKKEIIEEKQKEKERIRKEREEEEKKLKEIQAEQERWSKLTEEEKKKEIERKQQEAEKAEFEKKLKVFEAENKTGLIDDTNVVKNMISCSSKKTFVQKGEGNVNYCKTWALEYDKLKLLKGEVKDLQDLKLKPVCKEPVSTYLKGPNVKLEDNVGYTSVTAQNYIYYTCPSGTLRGTECKKLSKDIKICDEYYCKGWLPAKVCVGGCTWPRWYQCGWDWCSWSWTRWYAGGYGSSCYSNGYWGSQGYTEYVYRGKSRFANWVNNHVRMGYTITYAGRQSTGNNFANWFLGINSGCAKDTSRKLSDAIKHESYTYTITSCNKVEINYENKSLLKLYDPNFIMFQ